jgi:hypothetical protein
MTCDGSGGGGGPMQDSQATCYTTNDGACVTDGPGAYANNERCTISVLRSGQLYTTGTFTLESNYDGFSVPSLPNQLLDTTSEVNGARVVAGQNITWYSDGSRVFDGYVRDQTMLDC